MKVNFYPIPSHLRRPVALRNSPIMAMKTRNTFRSKKLDFFENHHLIGISLNSVSSRGSLILKSLILQEFDQHALNLCESQVNVA